MNALIPRATWTILLLTVANTAAAENLSCNRQQTRCVVVTNQLTIGDEVGVFNSSGELVATGRVQAMREDRRAVKIEKRYGRVGRSHKLALLESSPGDPDFESRYKLYRRPAEMSLGATMGLATIGIGNGAPATEISAFGQWRKWHGIQLVGRGSYIAAEGEVSRTELDGIETRPASVSGFGLLGGVAYHLRENKTIGFRGELAAGGLYANVTVAGDKELAEDPDFDTRFVNGFGKYLRGSASVLWNIGDWHVNLEVAETFAHAAMGTTIAGGVIMDLR